MKNYLKESLMMFCQNFLKDIRILTFSGNGEVFFRKESREFLEILIKINTLN